jgi:hypothetical protein
MVAKLPMVNGVRLGKLAEDRIPSATDHFDNSRPNTVLVCIILFGICGEYRSEFVRGIGNAEKSMRQGKVEIEGAI